MHRKHTCFIHVCIYALYYIAYVVNLYIFYAWVVCMKCIVLHANNVCMYIIIVYVLYCISCLFMYELNYNTLIFACTFLIHFIPYFRFKNFVCMFVCMYVGVEHVSSYQRMITIKSLSIKGDLHYIPSSITCLCSNAYIVASRKCKTIYLKEHISKQQYYVISKNNSQHST